MKIFLILMALTGLLVFHNPARAQVGGTGIPETSPVGVVSEEPPADNADDPNLAEMTINLSGGKCEINLNESELLRVKGVASVDIEAKPGKVVVGYNKTVVTKQQIKAAVGKKKGGCAANEEAGN